MAKAKNVQPRPRTLSDPLAAALLPPPNESPEERTRRVQAETDAKRNSERIDELLQLERMEKKKARPEVNVLLLGQSESGKSTTLKQFQLLYSPATFHSERIAWRAVIYLNLVRSVRRILEALAPESDALDDHDDLDSAGAGADIIISSNGRPASAILGTQVTKYEEYRRRLAPLVELEDRLTRLLASPGEDEPTHLAPPRPSWENPRNYYNNGNVPNGFAGRPAPTVTPSSRQTHHMPRSMSTGGSDSRSREVAVRPEEWKRTFQIKLGYKSKSPKTPSSGEIEGWWEDPDDPVHALQPCSKAMQDLWADPEVRQRLEEKRLRLEESSGFYLNEISRITAKKYFPTDADVLKARLKTTGVVDHTFMINTGSSRGVQWRIYDVGGARGQRQAWAPYFDDVNAIIFLAPISAFDQAKLEAGVRLNQHMFTYGDRPNDYESVSRYFYNKFGALHMAYTRDKERELYIHFTAVTDTRRTATIIASVRDIIIKANLRTMRLV